MDWDDLRVFLHVARHGRMGEAARALNIDHSTVSRRIARLEQDLGVLLFERAGRRTRITERGAELLLTAERVESLMLRNVAGLGETAGALTGRVRLGAPEGLGAGYLGRRLGAIAALHPGLEIELVALPRVYSLAAREVDLAITLERPAPGQVVTRKLTDYSLNLYAAPDYLAREGMPAGLDDLARHRFCGYIPELLFTGELDYLSFGGRSLTAAIRSTSVLAQADIIASGAAIGVLPAFLAVRHQGLQRLLPAEIGLTRSYWLSVHEDLRHLGRVRAVLEAVAEAVRSDRALFRPA